MTTSDDRRVAQSVRRKDTTIKFRNATYLGAAVVLVAMAGWLYFLGWFAVKLAALIIELM
jgi:hypothetical protein